MSTSKVQAPFYPIRTEDLKDPTLFRLNTLLAHILEEIASIQGATGRSSFNSEIHAKAAYLSSTDVPTEENAVLTLGAAEKLFGADVIREAFTKRSWQGKPVRPLPKGAVELESSGNVRDMTVESIEEDGINVTITISYLAPDPIGDFIGISAYVEAPKDSGNIYFTGMHDYAPDEDGRSYAVLVLPQPSHEDQTWKIFFTSRTSVVANKLNTETDPYVEVLVHKRDVGYVEMPDVTPYDETVIGTDTFAFRGTIRFPTDEENYENISGIEINAWGPLNSDGTERPPDTGPHIIGIMAPPSPEQGNVDVTWTSDYWPRPVIYDYYKIRYTKIAKNGYRQENDPYESEILEVKPFSDLYQIPDVPFFRAGRVDQEGNWYDEMKWDQMKVKMLIDWAVYAPNADDRVNWAGVALWTMTPDGKFHDASGMIPFSAFREDENGNFYFVGQHAIEPDDIPSPRQTWRLIAVSYGKNERPKVDSNGNPTGPYKDLLTLPKVGDGSNLSASVTEYQFDNRTSPAKPIAKITLSFTEPPNPEETTYYTVWVTTTSTSITNPPDPYEFKQYAAFKYGSSVYEFWYDRPAVGSSTVRLWIGIVVCHSYYHPAPDTTTPYCYVDITAPGSPSQVTSFSVSMEDITNGPSPAFKILITYVKPNDPEIWYTTIERIACDQYYNPLSGAVWEKFGDICVHATAGVLTTESFGPWPYPPVNPEYWKFRAVSISRAGIRNESGIPTSNLYIPPIGTISGTYVTDIPTASFASSIRPVVLVSSKPTFPNSLYPPGTMFYHTVEGRLYRVNSSGNDWQYAIDGSKDIVSDSITSGQIAAGAISTSELYAGEILVGSGGSKPTRFRVNDASGTMAAFLGVDDTGVYYNWFRDIRIGPSMYSPVIIGNSSGLQIYNAFITLTGTWDGVQQTLALDPSSVFSPFVLSSPYGRVAMVSNVYSGTHISIKGPGSSLSDLKMYLYDDGSSTAVMSGITSVTGGVYGDPHFSIYLLLNRSTSRKRATINFGSSGLGALYVQVDNTYGNYVALESMSLLINDNTCINSSRNAYFASSVSINDQQVLTYRQPAISNPNVAPPSSGSNPADYFIGDAYNCVYEIYSTLIMVLNALRTHGLIGT